MDSNLSDTPKKRCRRWKIPFFIAGIILIKSAVIMLLWNALVPELFHGPVLSYVQAVGLMILSKLLLGGGFRPGHRHFGPPWRHFAGLSEEERQKLREEMRHRCGH